MDSNKEDDMKPRGGERVNSTSRNDEQKTRRAKKKKGRQQDKKVAKEAAQ